MDPTEFKLNNLMNPDKGVMPVTCLQATIPEYNVHKIVEYILEKSEYAERKKAVDEYNAAHKWTKKGIAIMPLRFAHTHGFSQGQTVLVNVSASDGSVSAWTTGCEIGQGLFAKVAGTISQRLGVDISKVSVMEVNTQVTPNAMITGGSTTSECCCSAARNACDILKERLKPLKDHMTQVSGGKEPTWEELCKKSNGGGPGADQAGWDGYTPFTPHAIHVNLSASGIHQPKGRTVKDLLGESTVGNNLNGTTTGHGITDYFSTGASVSEVQVDVLTGVKTILRTDLVQDCGHSLNPQIDIGQCEGAFVIGLGFYLQEEVMIDPTNGFNHSHDTWEYKPCLNRDIPIEFNVELLKDSPFGETIDFEPVRGAKAVGEPPLLLALSAFNAVRAAVTASRVERGLSPQFKLEMPATVDRIQQALEMDSAEYAL
jgi:xanthine dehydrogenase/oxidase